MKRTHRAAIARETVDIVNRGHYEVAGKRINLRPLVAKCLAGTKLFTQSDLETLRDSVLKSGLPSHQTEIEVVNETTLEGHSRLIAGGAGPIAILNFASAKNPGGGFLNGSQAQEESLARSSALHASQLKVFNFYEQHRAIASCLYSDNMILSPDCPIFRNDDGELLPEPLLATFITSPAPNAGATADNHPEEFPLIPEVLHNRAELVLALAVASGHTNLSLGAWGCGVFRNDPKLVAITFAKHLHGKWAGRFKQILFSVLDTSPDLDTYESFRTVFKLI